MILVNTKTEYFVSDGGLVSRQEFWKVLPQSQEAFLLLLKRLITGVLTAMIMLVEMGRLPAWIPVIVLAREFIVSGYRLIAVEKGGKVIAASVWGKMKTVTQMIAIILAFVDINAFGKCFTGELTGISLGLNLVVTLMMIIQTIATIFSGYEYLKDGKELFKDC